MSSHISATRFRTLLGATVACGILVGALVMCGCSAGSTSRQGESAEQRVSPTETGAYEPIEIHGTAADRLDNPSESGLTLAEAISRSGLNVSLPDQALTGAIVKVVMNETVTDPAGRNRVGFMVLYETGIKLITAPGPLDLEAENEALRGSLPFQDGRELPYVLESVAGRPTLVGHAGVQYQGTATVAVPANLIWNEGDVEYWLKAPAPTETDASTGSSGADPEVDIDLLMRVAASMSPTAQ